MTGTQAGGAEVANGTPMGSGPITPEQAQRGRQVPTAVIDAFNERIAQTFDGTQAIVKQKDVVDLLTQRGFDRAAIFHNRWLDVEGIYESAGWRVTYDKPGYCEDYDATFIFERRA